MSTHRQIDKICAIAMAVAIILTVLFMNGTRFGITLAVDADAERHSDDSWFTANDLAADWDTSGATMIRLGASGPDDETNASAQSGYDDETDTATQDGSGNTGLAYTDADDIEVQGSGCYIYNGNVVIAQAGKYIVSGTLYGGSIVVDAEDTAKVWILFDGVTIEQDDDACLIVDQADKVFLTLAEGSVNTLTSGDTYSEEALSDNTDGTIFAHDDLTINGNGTLTVTAGYKHGIAANDDLVITGGKISVSSPKDAIHANDSLRVTKAVLNLSAEDDGMAVDNEGAYIYVESGDISIKCADEGMTAPGDITIAGGSISIATGTQQGHHGIKAGGTCTVLDGSIQIDSCYEGMQALYIDIQGGNIVIYPSDDGMNASTGDSSGEMPGMQGGPAGGMPGGAADGMTEGAMGSMPDAPAGGMPGGAADGMTEGAMGSMPDAPAGGMPGGAADGMTEGAMGGMPDAPADGMPGDSAGGTTGAPVAGMTGILTEGKQEGSETGTTEIPVAGKQEASKTGVSGVTADGVQADTMAQTESELMQEMSDQQAQYRPGNDGGQHGIGQPGNMPEMQNSEDTGNDTGTGTETETGTDNIEASPWIHISGGTILIENKSGMDSDGIDSNGDILISGGDVRISLNDSGMNNAIDYASENGGTLTITGGTIIACGSSGMLEGVSTQSTQPSITYITESCQGEDTDISLQDEAGKTLMSWTVPNSFSAIMVSCPEMKTGEDYVLHVGDAAEKVSINDIATSAGAAANSSGPMPGRMLLEESEAQG